LYSSLKPLKNNKKKKLIAFYQVSQQHITHMYVPSTLMIQMERFPGQGGNPLFMSSHRLPYLFPRTAIPSMNNSVLTARHQLFAIRGPSNAEDPMFVTCGDKRECL
jgi:hypothetical protein